MNMSAVTSLYYLIHRRGVLGGQLTEQPEYFCEYNNFHHKNDVYILTRCKYIGLC